MASLKPLPNREAIGFLEGKGYKTSYHWTDVWQEEHARAFTVAKVTRVDLLEDIRKVVDKVKSEGMSFRQFSKELMPRLEEYGWTGWKEMKDPLTGKVQKVELGTPRRLRIIYDTNLRMANAAGQWERAWRTRRGFGWMVYLTRADEKVRTDHRPWHKYALPIDDPFWDTHFPPNGWFCRCTTFTMTYERAIEEGYEVDKRPPVKMKDWTNPRTGEVMKIPEGISPGFGYNVGKAHMRGLTPPPRSGPLSRPATVADPNKLPMPKPRSKQKEDLLAPDVSAEAAIDAFLKAFKTKRGKPKVFRDKLDQPVVASEDLFLQPDGKLGFGKGLRAREAKLLADTIRDPDEIWWVWEKKIKAGASKVVEEYGLRRRYFARWTIGGEAVTTVVAFDVGSDGWVAVSASAAAGQEYLERQRGGTLAYRREE